MKKTSERKAGPAKKRGRPSKFTAALAIEICDRLKRGELLASICRDVGMPDPATVWDWRQSNESFSRQVARAREIGFDAIAAECLAIADDHEDDPASRRVRTEVRLKLLSKWDPKRYGDRLGLDNGQGGPLEIVIRKRYDGYATD